MEAEGKTLLFLVLNLAPVIYKHIIINFHLVQIETKPKQTK